MAERLHTLLDGKLEGGLYTDEASRSLWSTDASIFLRRPEAVVVARSEEDVRLALEAARECGIAITPRGTGTSLAGQATAPGLSLDVSGMDRILEVDVRGRRCVVEPGVIQGNLNARVAPEGLVFGADTSTSEVATLGGMIGNNSAGMRSVVYGTTSDQILSLRCILANGETVELRPLSREEAESRARENDDAEAILLRGALEISERHREEIQRRFPEMIRRVSGYGLDALVDEKTVDLTRLVCGSEGTLALVTRAELKLHPLPPERALASFQFDTLAAAARATVDLLKEDPSAVELLDDVAIRAAKSAPAYRESTSFVRGEPKALLLAEWSGEKSELDLRFKSLKELGERVGATEVVPLRDPEEMARTVKLRKSTLPLLLGTNDKEKPVAFVEDAAVPPARLEEFITRFEEIVHRNGTWACFYGHASVGTLHVRPALDTREPEGVARMRRIGEEVAALVRELGGSISGEHGDGLSRSEFLTMLYGEEMVEAFGEVKRLFDLGRVLNPGVILDAPRMDTNLRIGPGHRRLPLKTGLDFSSQGGFHHAVELCNGSGFCRKKDGGTMCPSYMATRQEEDTTRARANMLRSVLDGTLEPGELTGQRMKEVMDLCVGCKACKSECPSGVDVASMKTEVLYQTGKEHGFSLRQKGAGHVRRSLKLASKMPRLYNSVASSGLARRAASMAGIDPRRKLPQVTEKVFSKRFPNIPQGNGPELALFNDTWNEYQRPEIGEGAVRVLAAAGARMSLPEVVCCGRPMLSEGLIDEARANARRNLDLLTPIIDAGIPLVGLEPSCILTMRDDYAKLLPSDERVEKLAGLTRLFEEAFLELVDAGAEPEFGDSEGAPPVLLHGHCHQKALVGTGPMERALALATAEVQTVDSGCCGMAGLFGYEKGHYEASMQMGERKLLPAVRAHDRANGSGEVVAPGTSCREQISDGAGRRALHPAEYLASRLP